MNANKSLARPLAAIGLLALLGAGPAYAADAVWKSRGTCRPWKSNARQLGRTYAGAARLRLLRHHHAGGQ